MNLITRKFGTGLSTHDLVVQFHVTTTCLFVRDFWNFYALENICTVKRLESDHLNKCTVNNFPCVVKPAHLASPGSMLLSSSMLRPNRVLPFCTLAFSPAFSPLDF